MTTYRVRYVHDGSTWVASVEGLDGCHTQAATVPEARARIREALALFDDNAAEATLVDDVHLDDGDDDSLPEIDPANPRFRRIPHRPRPLHAATPFRRYVMHVEWSPEDDAFVARAPAFPALAAHGHTPDAAVNELETAGNAVLEAMAEKGLTPPDPDMPAR